MSPPVIIQAQWQVQSGRCWVPPRTLVILVHVCAAAQSAKGLGEGGYWSEGVVINKCTLSQSYPSHSDAWQQ